MAKATIFTINGKTYKAMPLDFNAVCDLEDNGITLSDLRTKPTSAARAYFALYFAGDKASAGRELQSHLINGGRLDDLFTAFAASIEESGFFQAFSKGAEETSEPDAEAETMKA